MSVITALPTTAGSIVTFEDWEDTAHTVKCRYVVTLVPGTYDSKTGEFTDVVWMDMYAEDGGFFNLSAEEILTKNPEVLFEAPAVNVVPAGSFDTGEERQYGTIVLVDHPDYGDVVAVFTPGAVDDEGTIIEGGWMNSYGAWFSQGVIEDLSTALLVKGTRDF